MREFASEVAVHSCWPPVDQELLAAPTPILSFNQKQAGKNATEMYAHAHKGHDTGVPLLKYLIKVCGGLRGDWGEAGGAGVWWGASGRGGSVAWRGGWGGVGVVDTSPN